MWGDNNPPIVLLKKRVFAGAGENSLTGRRVFSARGDTTQESIRRCPPTEGGKHTRGVFPRGGTTPPTRKVGGGKKFLPPESEKGGDPHKGGGVFVFPPPAKKTNFFLSGDRTKCGGVFNTRGGEIAQ